MRAVFGTGGWINRHCQPGLTSCRQVPQAAVGKETPAACCCFTNPKLPQHKRVILVFVFLACLFSVCFFKPGMKGVLFQSCVDVEANKMEPCGFVMCRSVRDKSS